MASSMMHYIIANQMIKQYHIQDENRFLLGATLGPDASSHEDGTYNIAHFSNTKGDRKGIDWHLYEKKYGDRVFLDEFYLGYWCHLIQDAVWFHDIVDKYIRIYTGETKKEYYQKGYRDYGKLNYLLQQEYNVGVPEFVLDIPAIDGISKSKMEFLNENFRHHFDALPCEREMLELYKWDIIIKFIEYSTSLCISEMEVLKRGDARVNPECFFVSI